MVQGENAKPPRRLWLLSLAALGVVFGDIGTSPLYALREALGHRYGFGPSPENVFGILSLITWALVLVVTLKYVLLVLRVDNEGEGGILALTSLLKQNEAPANQQGGVTSRRLVLASIGIFGAALLYGDGVLTPAISVLSAVEGLEIAAPSISQFVVPITVVILFGLFVLQRRGTARVGALFGPITLVWFLALAALGIHGILQNPSVLRALNPIYACWFILDNQLAGFLVLGAVFLVVTGAEALFADLGHFGKRPIRFAWFSLVFPALLLNYLGQGALVLQDPEAVRNPFYLLAPTWAQLALVVLATMATVIASQAVITGVFSVTMQAVQLGFSPRLEIRHTSPTEYGQIYVPPINWILMVSTILVVLAYGSSSALASAYGIAIVSAMIVDTLLLFAVAPARWNWPPAIARTVLFLFLAVELAFFGANISKIADGGWFPLVVAGAVFMLMITWRDVRAIVGRRLNERLIALPEFLQKFPTEGLLRCPGTAVYMTGNPRVAPTALLMNFEHQKILHERVVLLSVQTERVPHVRKANRTRVEELPHGFHRAFVSYGFMQTPDLADILRTLAEHGLELELAHTTFFLGRERVVPAKKTGVSRWRILVFSFLARNSQRATSFFNLPPERVVEVGSQIEV